MSDSHLVYDDLQDPAEMLGDCQAAGAAVASTRRDLSATAHDLAMAGAARMTATLHLD